MAGWIDDGLEASNNMIQGFVDMIPGGRSMVRLGHGIENYVTGENYNYEALTNKGSNFYTGGQIVGIGWNVMTGRGVLMTMRARAPIMAASKFKPVADLGNLIMTTRAIQNVDRARIFMEGCRAFCYSMKLWCNQARLNDGIINKQQFDKIQANDLLNYQMGGTMWALPGTYGLYVAGASMMFGTWMAQQNMDTVSRKK